MSAASQSLHACFKGFNTQSGDCTVKRYPTVVDK